MMCVTLLGTVFLKHKLSQADSDLTFCYSLSVLLMVKVSLWWTKPNEKLVEKRDQICVKCLSPQKVL